MNKRLHFLEKRLHVGVYFKNLLAQLTSESWTKIDFLEICLYHKGEMVKRYKKANLKYSHFEKLMLTVHS